MAIPRRTRVTLSGDGEPGRRREFCLSRPVALLLGGVMLITWVVAGLLAFGVVQGRRQEAKIADLERQLAAARTEALTARVLQAELDRNRRLQADLMELLGVAPVDSAGGPTTVVPREAAAGPGAGEAAAAAVPPAADPGAAPARWPAAGAVIREFTRGDAARGVEAHLGVDIAGPEGSRVVAAAEGDVDFVGEDDVLGKYVEIRHGLDWVTIYGHCATINVGPGHRVRAGEQVAKMGRTGQTSTAQVHFEVWHRGEAVDPRKHISGEPAAR